MRCSASSRWGSCPCSASPASGWRTSPRRPSRSCSASGTSRGVSTSGSMRSARWRPSASWAGSPRGASSWRAPPGSWRGPPPRGGGAGAGGRRLERLEVPGEILVVDGGSTDGTPRWAAEAGARVLTQPGRGYADALLAGLRAARGRFVLTLDADYSHDPDFVDALWARRAAADLVVASRYVPGGHAPMPLARKLLSRVLHAVRRWACS